MFDDQLVVCARAALIGGRFSHGLTPGTLIVALCVCCLLIRFHLKKDQKSKLLLLLKHEKHFR